MKDKMVHYFAYGSNMNQGDLNNYCIKHKRQPINLKSKNPKNAILHGYQLVFNYHSSSRGGGAANVKAVENPTSNDYVEGVLFCMNKEDFKTIEKKEGSPNCYSPKPVNIELVDGTIVEEVITFVVVREDKKDEFIPPTREYLNIIIEGAKDFGLSKVWIEKLERIEVKNVNR